VLVLLYSIFETSFYAVGYLIIVVYCLQCGSGRSVAPIKAGFVARVGRRTAGGT
jgi:hypothetical protein